MQKRKYDVLVKIAKNNGAYLSREEFNIFLGKYGVDPEYPGKAYDVKEGVKKYELVNHKNVASKIRLIHSRMKNPSAASEFYEKAYLFIGGEYELFNSALYKVDFLNYDYEKYAKGDKREYDDGFLSSCAEIFKSKKYDENAVKSLIKDGYFPFKKTGNDKIDSALFCIYLDELRKTALSLLITPFATKYNKELASGNSKTRTAFLEDCVKRAVKIVQDCNMPNENIIKQEGFIQFAAWRVLSFFAEKERDLNYKEDQEAFLKAIEIFFKRKEIPLFKKLIFAEGKKVAKYESELNDSPRIVYSKIKPKLRVVGEVVPKSFIPSRNNVCDYSFVFDILFCNEKNYFERKQ